MSDTAATTNNSEETQVTSAIDALLSENDPKKMSYEEFRGAQFDHGLAWVYFDEGNGGLGVNPVLQRIKPINIYRNSFLISPNLNYTKNKKKSPLVFTRGDH